MESLRVPAHHTAVPLIAVGGSAGAIEALRAMLPSIPRDLPAAIALVLHRAPIDDDDRLRFVLSKGSALPLRTARDGDPIVPGFVYVAPAAVHLEAEPERFRLTAGALENHSRPSIDVLFRSVAAAFGRAGAGVVLSGMLADGSAGLAAIKAAGGTALVQDPETADFPSMPRNALASVDADAVAGPAELARAIARFARGDLPLR